MYHQVNDTAVCDTDHVTLADLTWQEIESAVQGGVDTIIVPLGATEQHGPHLPVGTDTRIATALAERIARNLEDALVAPPVPVGPSDEHAAFPGTLSISPDTLTAVLRDYVSSFESQGFTRVVILPGHGGSFSIVDAAYAELARTEGVDLVAITRLQRYMELLDEGLSAAGIDVDEPVVHAGASETAMLLAIEPSLVEGDLPEGHTGTVSAAALFADGVETYDESGVLGDARPATAAAGEVLLEHITDAYTAYIRDEFHELNARR